MIALTCTLILLLVAIPLSILLWAIVRNLHVAAPVRERMPMPYDSNWPLSEADLFRLTWGHGVDYARTEHDRARLIRLRRQMSKGAM